jgi:hypothetical protein
MLLHGSSQHCIIVKPPAATLLLTALSQLCTSVAASQAPSKVCLSALNVPLQVLQWRLAANSSSSSIELVEADAQVELVDAEPAKLPDLTGTWIKVRLIRVIRVTRLVKFFDVLFGLPSCRSGTNTGSCQAWLAHGRSIASSSRQAGMQAGSRRQAEA